MRKIIIQAKSKYPKEETTPYNPWAVCNTSTGGKKDSPEKFERCVHHLKDQNRKSHKGEKKKAQFNDEWLDLLSFPDTKKKVVIEAKKKDG